MSAVVDRFSKMTHYIAYRKIVDGFNGLANYSSELKRIEQ